MNQPDLNPTQRRTAEATSDYEGRGGPAARPKVALVPGSGLKPTSEIQTLLRKRLRFFALVNSGGFAIILLVLVLPWTGIGPTFWVSSAVVAVFVVSAWLLWTTRPLSLRQLRVIELIVFGAYVAAAVWTHYKFFVPFWAYWKPDEPAFAYWYPVLLAFAESLPWVFLILAYGTLIPNTWWRCAAVVGIMAIVPLVLSASSGLAGAAMEGRPLLNLLTNMGVNLAGAVALAVFGSHRIETLRREAFEARKLGQYQLKQRIGSGGMGEVYLAEHVLLRRPCAIKLIRPERAGDPKNLRRFEREVQATATLTNWHTVEIFDYGHTADGTFYYVMEYLPGLNLEQLVSQQGPQPPERAVHLLRQVCSALREAHAIGLIHRDIKPSNIITCERGGLQDVAKLLDFGLVQVQTYANDEKLTQEGSIAGTPAFMSPEQAAGQEELDARCDIYSLGAVAFYLLTGQPPFVRKTGMQTLAAHLTEPLPSLRALRAEVSTDLEAVVLRCLAKDPAMRYQDAESLDQALASCC